MDDLVELESELTRLRPMRRLRTSSREILQWQDARSGAQLKVSYPAEEIVLIPVSGQ